MEKIDRLYALLSGMTLMRIPRQRFGGQSAN